MRDTGCARDSHRVVESGMTGQPIPLTVTGGPNHHSAAASAWTWTVMSRWSWTTTKFSIRGGAKP